MLKNFIRNTVLLVAFGSALAGCGATKTAESGPSQNQIAEPIGQVERDGGSAYIPRAVIYRTNGGYDNHVTVVLNPDGVTLHSYPGPGDVSTGSAPLHVADGWLLDRRGGISKNTRFLRWTYVEYHSFPQVPRKEVILRNIVPNARVTEAWRLPIPATPVDTAAVNALIRQGLPGCTRLF